MMTITDIKYTIIEYFHSMRKHNFTFFLLLIITISLWHGVCVCVCMWSKHQRWKMLHRILPMIPKKNVFQSTIDDSSDPKYGARFIFPFRTLHFSACFLLLNVLYKNCNKWRQELCALVVSIFLSFFSSFSLLLLFSILRYIQAFGSKFYLCVFYVVGFFFFFYFSVCLHISSIIISIAATVLWCLYECVYCCVCTFFFRRLFLISALGSLISQSVSSVFCNRIWFSLFLSKIFTRCRERFAMHRTSHGSLTAKIHCLLFVLFRWVVVIDDVVVGSFWFSFFFGYSLYALFRISILCRFSKSLFSP